VTKANPPTIYGPVPITSDMPAVMIDSPAAHGVFGHPDDDDIIVANRGSKRGRAGCKVSTVWEYLTNDINSNTLPFVSCQHSMSMVSTEK
jgi:hypothetical protein